jgi:hypothetical protein
LEVLEREADRTLIHALVRRLAEVQPEVARVRAAIHRTVAGELQKDGILAALRRLWALTST